VGFPQRFDLWLELVQQVELHRSHGLVRWARVGRICHCKSDIAVPKH
jgi:hypothetical protein